jgi:hypothetical protein
MPTPFRHNGGIEWRVTCLTCGWQEKGLTEMSALIRGEIHKEYPHLGGSRYTVPMTQTSDSLPSSPTKTTYEIGLGYRPNRDGRIKLPSVPSVAAEIATLAALPNYSRLTESYGATGC